MKKIIIEGITNDGKEFRPSDWIERMCGSLASFQNRRIHYDPRLLPTRTKAEIRCLQLDTSLKTDYAELFNSIMEFAEKNNLRHYEIELDDDNVADK